MKRTLSLKRESLSSLTSDELAGVNAAAVSVPNPLCAVVEPSGQYMCTWQPTRCLCP